MIDPVANRIIARLLALGVILLLVGSGASLSDAARSEGDDDVHEVPADGSDPEEAAADEDEEPEDPNAVRIGRLVYGPNKKAECFSPRFLQLAEYDGTVTVSKKFRDVRADSEDLFGYPMVIMSGDGEFVLSQKQRENLRAYLKRGGFILASAFCSDRQWAASFRAELEKLLPDARLEPLELEHPLFHTLYDIESIRTVRPAEQPILGLHLDKRLAIVYSALGLNDSGTMGAECCCCGANEVRNARYINANIMLYVLTH